MTNTSTALYAEFLEWKRHKRIQTNVGKNNQNAKRIPVIKSLRRHGYSAGQIAELMGFSRQRVYQILPPPKRKRIPRVKKPRICLVCKVPLEGRRRRCPSCALKRTRKLRRIAYKTDPLFRAKVRAHNKRWQDQNQDRFREIQRRAARRYQEAHREDIKLRIRTRYANDPVFRQKRLAMNSAWSKTNRKRRAT